MKRLATSLAVVAALLVGASMVWAEDGDAPKEPVKKDQPKKEPGKDQPRKEMVKLGQYTEMAKVLALSEDAQKKVAEVVAAQNQANKEFNEANGEKMKALGEEMKKAREAKDEAAMKKVADEMKPLNEKRMEIGKKANADVMALLTDEQKAAWEQHVALKYATMRYRKAELTEEQTAKIKTAYAEAVKGVDMNDAKAREAAMKKLSESIEKDILTDAQREAIKPKPRAEGDKPVKEPRPERTEKPKDAPKDAPKPAPVE